MGAINSIRLFVVCGLYPNSSLLTEPKRRMQAHPPGPGFPRQEPSVINRIFFTSSGRRTAYCIRAIPDDT